MGRKLDQNSAMPSRCAASLPPWRVAASTPASTAVCRRACTSHIRAASTAMPLNATIGNAMIAVMIVTLPRRVRSKPGITTADPD